MTEMNLCQHLLGGELTLASATAPGSSQRLPLSGTKYFRETLQLPEFVPTAFTSALLCLAVLSLSRGRFIPVSNCTHRYFILHPEWGFNLKTKPLSPCGAHTRNNTDSQSLEQADSLSGVPRQGYLLPLWLLTKWAEMPHPSPFERSGPGLACTWQGSSASYLVSRWYRCSEFYESYLSTSTQCGHSLENQDQNSP